MKTDNSSPTCNLNKPRSKQAGDKKIRSTKHEIRNKFQNTKSQGKKWKMQSKEYFYHLTGKFIIIRYYNTIDDEFGHCLICEIYENNKRENVVIWFSAKHRPQIVLNLPFWWEKSLLDSLCSVFQRDFFQRRKNIITSVTSLLHELFFRHIPKKT